ncbi:Heme-binding-like protein, chloroplastic [Symbiodinium microadriaticum]|uniref:Heme-binding-like protein, chloroplastic n=1 Tax=Symbiodinium microadriaticum TaxID=2951 RepID=A0A1Q9DDQ2_SYMMI|nr:Heme-binding-like protein, chloroplastic [Symbiodinium microadriaticum]
MLRNGISKVPDTWRHPPADHPSRDYWAVGYPPAAKSISALQRDLAQSDFFAAFSGCGGGGGGAGVEAWLLCLVLTIVAGTATSIVVGKREGPDARVSRRAEGATLSEDPPAAAAEWRPSLRRLLLARRSDVRQEALKELSGIFDEVSVEIFDEIERYGRDSKGVPALRLRPFLGYRAACASLYRTVTNHILPQQAGSPVELQKRTRDGEQRLRYVLKNDVLDANGQEDGEEAEAEVSDASKARALFVVLRQLVSNTAWAVERSAIQAAAGEGEWKQRTPDLETPDYEVLYRDALNGYEVREYAPYAVVRTAGQGGEAANNRSFFMLADYIFGKKNERNEKMAMTTPVQMDKSTGTMSFIMPSKYWGESLSEAPSPAEDAGVTLQARPGERVAVSIFGGYAVGSLVARKTEELLDSVAESEEWELAENATRLLQYNDPFTVPWKRRNEVSVPVRQRA